MNGVESDDETPQVSISESDDDVPQLSAGTMAALMEFFKEEEERKDKLRQIEEGEIPDTFEEDWVRGAGQERMERCLFIQCCVKWYCSVLY